MPLIIDMSCGKMYLPGVSKDCCLEVFKYLRASKKHGTFVTPGTNQKGFLQELILHPTRHQLPTFLVPTLEELIQKRLLIHQLFFMPSKWFFINSNILWLHTLDKALSIFTISAFKETFLKPSAITLFPRGTRWRGVHGWKATLEPTAVENMRWFSGVFVSYLFFCQVFLRKWQCARMIFLELLLGPSRSFYFHFLTESRFHSLEKTNPSTSEPAPKPRSTHPQNVHAPADFSKKKTQLPKASSIEIC